jgi:hypothetical protein
LTWHLLTVSASVVVTATATLVGVSVSVTGTVATPVTGLQRAVEEGPDHPLGVETGNAGHHVDSEAGQHRLGAITHSSGEHSRRSLLTQPTGERPRFVRWGVESFGAMDRAALTISPTEQELLRSSKMGTEFARQQWNCDNVHESTSRI